MLNKNTNTQKEPIREIDDSGMKIVRTSQEVVDLQVINLQWGRHLGTKKATQQSAVKQQHQNYLENQIGNKGQRIIVGAIGFLFMLGIFMALILTLIKKNENDSEFNFREPSIVFRNFEKERIYHSTYIVKNLYENYTTIIYYDSTIAVLNAGRDVIEFAASLLKRKQQKIEKNGSATVYQFHKSNPFLNILQTGENNQSLSQDISNGSTQLIPSQFREASNSTKTLPGILPVYRFSLYSNGSVNTYTFPTQLQKQYVGLLRSVTKLFSPILDLKLYTSQQSVVKRKLKQGDYVQIYVGSINNSNSSNITSPDQKYEEVNGYNFESSDEGVTLYNQGQISSSASTHNTNQVNTQTSQFDENGQLVKGSQSSNTQFNSVQQNPDPNFSVINLNLSFSSYQTSEMNLIVSFHAETSRIQKFSGLISYYESQNLTLTTDPAELVNYILGLEENIQTTNGTIRLLLQSDGSLLLLKFYKETKIFSTNVLGCEIGAYGYTSLGLNLYQDPENKYRKIPKIKTEIGTILQLAVKKFIVPLIQYEKDLPPLSMKYTLQQVQGVVDLIKGDFLSKLKEIWDLIVNGEFDENLLPNIMKVLALAQDVSTAITSSQNQNSPTQIISEISQIMIQINQAITTQGMSLLNPQNMLVGNLSQELLSFVNVSYADALAVFNLAKSTFNGLKEQGTGFLSQMLTNFTQLDIKEIGQKIKNLIPPDVYAQYEKQMKKAQPILLFISTVKKNGTDYLNYITQTFNSQKTDFLKFIKGVIDLYFANQTLKTDSAFNKIVERVHSVEQEVQSFRNLASNFNISKMNQKIIQLYRNVLLDEFGDNKLINDWNTQIQALQSLANGISSQKGNDNCCQRESPAWWQFWEDKQCVRYNNAFQSQASEPQLFKSLKELWTSLFKSYTQKCIQFVSKSKQIILNPSLKIDEKHQQIKLKFMQVSQSVKASSIQDLKQKISEGKTKAQQILQNVGCGGTANLREYISKLGSLSIFVGQLKFTYQLLQTKTQNVLNSFSGDAYNKILNNFIIEQSVQNFFKNYKQMEQSTKSIINDLKSIAVNYDPQQFVMSNTIASRVYQLYEKITESLGIICGSFQQQKSQITGIRRQYRTRLDTINQITNNFLADELNQIRFFLHKASTTVYESFLTVPFCQHQQTFSKQISTLMQDFNNFTLIYTLYNKFMVIVKRNNEVLIDIEKQIGMISKKFYRLFTPDGFQQFIKQTHTLTQTIKTLVYNVSIDFSNIKQEAKSIQVFKMAPLSNLNLALEFFVSSPFTLHVSNMFVKIKKFVNSSLSAIQSLSFDILAVIVVSKDVLQYFEETVTTFVKGTPVISEKFKILCQSFLDLQQTTGQQYINQISTNFLNLIKVVNNTIFPNISQRMNEIINRYQRYRFTNANLQNLKSKCIIQLSNFANLSERTKARIFGKMNDIMQNIKSIIAKLQIGNLNKIYKLAVYIKDEFSAVVKFFLAQLTKIGDYKNQLFKDLRKIFKIGQFLDGIKSSIQQKYEQTVTNIKNKVNETMIFFSQNRTSGRLLQDSSDFMIKFKKSSSFSKLEQIGQKLILNFQSIWDKITQKQTKIRQFVERISNDSVQLIKQLGQAKQQFINITDRVNERIKNITNEFQIVKRKLTNIKSLIFISIGADFKGTIMTSMAKIINQTDNIINIDLVAIRNVSSSSLLSNIPLINRVITTAIDGYNNLIPIRDKVIGTIEEGLDKIDEFLSENVVDKMQKLKEGILYLKSVSDSSPDDPKSVVLYHKQLYSKRAPIFNFKQPIITAIGVFMINFDLNYTIDINAYIVLRDFRSIDCKVVFQTALVMDLRFGYSLAYILQFGLYVSGNVLRAQVIPMLSMENIIPVQLVEAIASIPELNQDNKVSIVFTVDLGIYAVQLDIGFYIAHIWIELIWQDFQICIDLWFTSFCFSFKLPVGFRFFMRRNDFGYKINGIQMMKKRILTLKILQHGY